MFEIKKGSHKGGVIVMGQDEKQINQIIYSWGQGFWEEVKISEKEFEKKQNIVTEPSYMEQKFFVYRQSRSKENSLKGYVVALNFQTLHQRVLVILQCQNQIINLGFLKILNQENVYLKKRKAKCFNQEEIDKKFFIETCSCIEDVGNGDPRVPIADKFEEDDDTPDLLNPPSDCKNTYIKHQAIRKVSRDYCQGGIDLSLLKHLVPFKYQQQFIQQYLNSNNDLQQSTTNKPPTKNTLNSLSNPLKEISYLWDIVIFLGVIVVILLKLLIFLTVNHKRDLHPIWKKEIMNNSSYLVEMMMKLAFYFQFYLSFVLNKYNKLLIIQFSYHIRDLQQRQIKIGENLMLNLDQIKAENLNMFPQDLVIEKNQYIYEFVFEQQHQPSRIQKCNYDPLQNQEQSFHFSKNILKLLVKLKQYNIYIATLSQKSFLETGNPQQLTKEEFLGNQGQSGQFILYNFGLENWKNVSVELMNSYCLSPELINDIQNECNLDNFELIEQMRIVDLKNQFFKFQKSNLTKYNFINGFLYEIYLIAQLNQKCVIDKEEETATNRQLTQQEALDQMLYIDKCIQYTIKLLILAIQKELKTLKNRLIQFGSSLHEQLTQKLKYKASHQTTGRLFILQNLIKIKFIYLIFQEDQFSYFRNFLIMKLIIQELQITLIIQDSSIKPLKNLKHNSKFQRFSR